MEATLSDIRQAMTTQLDKRLNECARTGNLNDGKLLAILSGGDVVAQELKYHRACLTVLYNKERTVLSKYESENNKSDKDIHPIVFAEVLIYIMVTKISDEGTVTVTVG